jgi:amino acid permease
MNNWFVRFIMSLPLEHAFGKWFGYVMRALTVFVTTGAQTVYIVVLGDIVPPIIETLFKHKVHWIFYNRTFVTAVIVVIFLIPCGMLRTLDALKYPSAIAVFAVIYLVVLVVVYRFIKPATDLINSEAIVWINPSWDIFLSFPIIIYAHNCHVLVFPIMKEVKNPTHSRMEWSTRFAVLIYGGLYMLIGVVGYLSFFSKTKDNILHNFGTKFDVGLLAAQVGIGFTAIFSFPLQMYACRNSLNLIFFEGKPFSAVRHTIFALILIGFTFTLGTLVPKIGTVFGFIGASAGITVMFIMP